MKAIINGVVYPITECKFDLKTDYLPSAPAGRYRYLRTLNTSVVFEFQGGLSPLFWYIMRCQLLQTLALPAPRGE
jgi:hypothetical protein